jgi:hypothetical protein
VLFFRFSSRTTRLTNINRQRRSQHTRRTFWAENVVCRNANGFFARN